MKFDGHNRLALRSMPWYVELTLTGLVENIAEAQLFGSLKGAYTGAVDRAGVFEQAIRGRSPKGREPTASLLTGGVVFLDEIGDLSPVLQAKLLPVLSGAPTVWVGKVMRIMSSNSVAYNHGVMAPPRRIGAASRPVRRSQAT